MARDKNYKFQKESRANRIAKCLDCKGNPPIEGFNLQGMCGIHCGKCMEVISWEKIGKLITVKEKVKITTTAINGSPETITLINTITPGKQQLNFTDLEL